MSFSFRNIFSPDDQNPDSNAEGIKSQEFPSSLERGSLSPKPAPINTEVRTFLVSELLPFIPKAIAAQSGIPMDKEVAVPLPADGSLDVSLSSIFGACPELFAAEITPSNDSVVTLPPRLGSAAESDGFSEYGNSGFANSFTQSGDENSTSFWSPVTPSSDTNAFQGKPPVKSTDSKNQAWSGGSFSGGPSFETQPTSSEHSTIQSPGVGTSASVNAPKDAPFSSIFSHGFGTPTPAQESKDQASLEENRAATASKNPFQGAGDFSTLFSKQREKDQSIPFPTSDIPSENHSPENDDEPEGIWGAMFRGIDMQGDSSVAKETNPPYDNIGKLLNQTSTTQISEEAQSASPVSEMKFSGFATPASVQPPAENPFSSHTPVENSQQINPLATGNDSPSASFKSTPSTSAEPDSIPANPFHATATTPPTLPPASGWSTPASTSSTETNPFQAYVDAGSSWGSVAAVTPPPLPSDTEAPSPNSTPVFHGFEPSGSVSKTETQAVSLATDKLQEEKSHTLQESSVSAVNESPTINPTPVFQGFSDLLKPIVSTPESEFSSLRVTEEASSPDQRGALVNAPQTPETASDAATMQKNISIAETPPTSKDTSFQPFAPVTHSSTKNQEESNLVAIHSASDTDSRSVTKTEPHRPSSSTPIRPTLNADDPDRDLELCAIFSTSERFTLAKVARKVVGLQGIESCSLSIPGQFVQASRKEESRSSQEAREMVASLRNFAKFAGLKDAHTFTMQTDQGVVSVFLDGESCLTVQHSSTSFAPGIREKLILASRCIGRLQD